MKETKSESKKKISRGTTKENKFYVYGHYRKDTGEIFYIGRGCKNRAYASTTRNKYWHNIVDKHGYTVSLLHENLTSEVANEYEIGLILFYGRKGLGTGPLVNATGGGDGALSPTPELRNQMSNRSLKMWSDQDKRALLVSKRREFNSSSEGRRKNSEGGKRRYRNDPNEAMKTSHRLIERYKNPAERIKTGMSIAKKEYPSIISPVGVVYPPFKNLRKFCRDNNVNRWGLRNLYGGKYTNFNGWRLL